MSAARRPASGAPSGAWSAGLCDCCQDAGLSCTVCFCSCNATGQVYQRATRRANSCFWISALAWSMFVATQILNSVANAHAQLAVRTECAWFGCVEYTDWDRVATASVAGGVAGSVGLVGTALTTYFVCTSRRLVRARDRISTGACGGCEDCCVSYWCGCCSLIQLLRQDGITGNSYRACSSTAVAV